MKDKNIEKIAQEIVANGGVKNLEDLNGLMSSVMQKILQKVLETELTHSLGYDKNQHKKEIVDNYRNGYSSKTVKSTNGPVELKIPRDRKGEFQPQIIEKYQKDISNIENKIILLYAKGNSTRDIQQLMSEMFGIDIDASLVSHVTNKILPEITEWNNRPLDRIYPSVFIDGIRLKLNKKGTLKKNLFT